MSETSHEGGRCAYELCKRSDPITVIAGHRPRRYHDENCRQAQHRLQKRRAQVNEDDQARCQPLAEVEEERAKYAALLADYMQLVTKMSHLENQVQRFQRMKVLVSRESMLQELMVLGGRLTYASLTDLGIGEGIDQWLAYVRDASDEELALAIAHGYYQADRLALAVYESPNQARGEMRQRIEDLERAMALKDARIAELEAERATWIAWKEAEVRGCDDLTAMRQYLQEHPAASIPVMRNGVTLKIWALGENAVAFSEAHGLVRLNDEELQQGRVWVCQKTGVPAIATRQPLGSSRRRGQDENQAEHAAED